LICRGAIRGERGRRRRRRSRSRKGGGRYVEEQVPDRSGD